jgi:predicted nucleic acid-binding protein
MGDAGTAWLDTNIIIRYLTGTPEHLARRATEIIDGDRDLVVSELVLSEAAYVFSSVYRAPRIVVVDALSEFLQRANIRLHFLTKPEALTALDLCRDSGRVSFADALLWAIARKAGAGLILTFDERFPSEGIELGK